MLNLMFEAEGELDWSHFA